MDWSGLFGQGVDVVGGVGGRFIARQIERLLADAVELVRMIRPWTPIIIALVYI